MTGLVLAGGRSRRMGVDKVLLQVQGRRLIDISLDVLHDVCDRVLVAAGDRAVPGRDVETVNDAEGQGPLAGIVAGLRASATPLLAVLAADMPLASAAVLERLATVWDGEPAVVPRAGGVMQPLHAVYAAGAAQSFGELLAAGEQSPARAIERLGGRVVDADVYDPDGSAGAFWTNVNAPEDLRRLEARRGGD